MAILSPVTLLALAAGFAAHWLLGRLARGRGTSRADGQRNDAVQLLERREHELREALTAACMGTWRWDVELDAITWSSSCYEVFRIAPSDFGGNLAAFAALVHPEDRARVMARIADITSRRLVDYCDEFRVVVGDGTERWVEGRGRLEPERGGRTFFTGTVMDVTSRKQAERALRDSELRFQSLAETAFEGIAITSNGRIVDFNERFAATLGYPSALLLGMEVAELVHPDDRELVASQMRAGAPEPYQHRALRGDGGVIVVEVQARSLPMRGVTGRITSIRDVTRQREYESQLLRIAEGLSSGSGEAFFRSLVENLAVSLRADLVYVARSSTGDDCMETLACWGQDGQVDDFRFDPRRSPHANAISGEIHLVHQDLARLFPDDDRITSSGMEGYVGAALFDPPGQVAGLLVAMFRKPVTEASRVLSTLRIFAARCAAELARRRVEGELRDSETRLRATIDSSPNVAVQWYDPSGRVQFWNRASENMFGWSAGEALGRSLDQLIHTPEEGRKFVDTLGEIAGTGKVVGPIESRFRRKDGSAGICVSTLFEIPTGSGQRAFVCMDVDVTARKRAEQRHEELARHLLVAQETERRRLAHELHDSLGQSLSLIKNRAHLARNHPGEQAQEQLDAIERLVADSIAEVRTLAHNLVPLPIEQSGLTAALRTLVEDVAACTLISFSSRIENVDDVVPTENATQVYRIAQEALHNLVRHSRARNAYVTLQRDVRCVRLRVTDDGVGFQPDKVGTGLGLQGMSERARMLGGGLTLDGEPGVGTTISLELPVSECQPLAPFSAVDGQDEP